MLQEVLPQRPLPAPTPPLHGVRVLDLMRLLPGPMCTLHLADLGADVIKIEDTGAGDYASPEIRGLVNRNKRGLRLDLKQPAGVEAFMRLAGAADVVVEGFRPGVAERLGIGYAAVARRNARLVYCSITGYGQGGPCRDQPGHDLNYCAQAGLLRPSPAEGPPALPAVPMADLIGGSLGAVMGILAALFDAQRSGLGRHVDVAIADGLLAHAVVPLAALAAGGEGRVRDMLGGALPCYTLYPTADGRQLAVAALERKFWDRLCERIGRVDLQAGHPHRDLAQAAQVWAELAALFRARPLAHWVEVFRGTECCVSPVLSLDEALQHEQVAARGMRVVSEPPDGTPLRQLACPLKMTRFEFEVRRPAPAAGQHSAEILAEAGYSAAEVAGLRGHGVVA